MRNEKGMALVTAMVMLLALTLMGFMMMNTANLQTRTSGATKEEAQALMLAEAGIARMKSFFKDALDKPRGDPVTYVYNGSAETLSLVGSYGTANSIALIPYKDNYSGGVGNYTTLEWRFFRKRLKDLEDVPQFINANYSQFTDPDANGFDAATVTASSRDSYNPVDHQSQVAALSSVDEGELWFAKKYGRPAFYIYHQPTLDKLFSDFAGVGKVKFLGIYPPIGLDQSPGSKPPRQICTIRAEVETPGGYTRTIEQELTEPPILPVTAGAQAGAGGAWDGSGSIRWGPVKVIGNNLTVGGSGNNVPWQCATVGGNPKSVCTQTGNTDCYDKWFTLKVGLGNTFIMPGSQPLNDCTGETNCGGAGLTIGCADINGPTSSTPPYLSNSPGNRRYKGIKGYSDMPLYDPSTQPDGLKLDQWEKGPLKEWASNYNLVYTYDGNYFYRGDFSTIPPGTPPITFADMFDPAGSHIGKSGFVYIQMATGILELNFATNKIPGDYTKGTIYVDGNVKFSGGGGGRTIQVKNPDQYLGLASGTTTLNGINLEGILYATGYVGSGTGTGTIAIFGAILAETGHIALGGNGEVWYDKSLIENSAGPKMPMAEKGKWREIRQ